MHTKWKHVVPKNLKTLSTQCSKCRHSKIEDLKSPPICQCHQNKVRNRKKNRILSSWITHQNYHTLVETMFSSSTFLQPKILNAAKQSHRGRTTKYSKIEKWMEEFPADWILITIWILGFMSFEGKSRFLQLCLWSLVRAEREKENEASAQPGGQSD